MSPKYTREMHEEYRREQVEKAAKEERERRERLEEDIARRAYMAEGGTEEEFEKAWPQMREEGRRQRAMSREREAREGQRARGLSRI